MNGKTYSFWAVLLLVVVGVGSIIVRWNLKFDRGDSDYLLTYSADFHVRKPDGRLAVVADARLFASIPETTRFCKVELHDINAPDMEIVHHRMHTAESSKNIELRTPRAGQLSCDVTFRLRLDRNGEWSQHDSEPPLTPEQRLAYIANAKGMTATAATAHEILNRLRDRNPSGEELVKRIFAECRKIESTGELGNDSGDATLSQQKGSPLGRARAMVTLCRAAKIPARLATGFEIAIGDPVPPRTWVEVYLDRWEPYDLEYNFARELPHNVVTVRHDGISPIRVTNSTDLVPSYKIASAPATVRTMLSILDLHRLPGKLHEPIKVVLILPIGALLTSLLRTIVGIRTFGTFSPTLLALAFVYNDFLSGLCIFAVVVATGFISRGVLDRLKLLLVPRLSIILTLVVMLMVLGIAVMNYFKELSPSGQTVLLPMVILTNLVERFYVTSEEDNFLYAMRLLVTTMLVALAIYLLLNWRVLGDALFSFPELHCFTVAILILMGRYTGYRLTELMRFRDLVWPRED